jgi:hypothetical protein
MPGSQLTNSASNIRPLIDVVTAVNGQNGYLVLATGQATLSRDFTKLSKSDLKTGDSRSGLCFLEPA